MAVHSHHGLSSDRILIAKEHSMSKTSADREDDSIDLNNPEHVNYWTQQFGITRETLGSLIKANGSRAADLRLILNK